MENKMKTNFFGKAKNAVVGTVTAGVATFTMLWMSAQVALAEKVETPAEALKKAGIESSTIDGETSGLFASFRGIVNLVMGVGGLWSVFWIVIGGILLSGSGGNAQKRSAGMTAIVVAAAGLFVIYKANDIAGWAISLGDK